MIETGLIIIDGIAGSGKSVAGQRLYRTLHLDGHPAEFYHEFHRPHPVLHVEADSESGWVEQSLLKWQRFVNRLTTQDGIAILDGALFQCGVGELLERGAETQIVNKYFEDVIQLIAPAKPLVVYLYQKNIGLALETVWRERPDAWRKRVAAHFPQTAHGRTRKRNGFDLYLDFNRSLRRLSDKLRKDMNAARLFIDNSDRRWDDSFDEIRRFLKLRDIADSFDPADYCGNYIDNERNHRCQLAVVDGALTALGLFEITKSLLPKRDDTVFVKTWPDELTFSRDAGGRVESFRSTGPWDRLGGGRWEREQDC